MNSPSFRPLRVLPVALLVSVVAVSVHAATKERDQKDKDTVEAEDRSQPGLLIGIMGDRELKDFEETRQRPLFTPVRHPPLPPPPPPPPPPPKEPKPKVVKVKPPTPPTLRLIGVVMTEESKLALLLDKDRKVQRLALGDKFEGWSVAKLGADSVELRQKGERSVYRMFDNAEQTSGQARKDRGRKKKRGRRNKRR
jgi:hypothetical protein